MDNFYKKKNGNRPPRYLYSKYDIYTLYFYGRLQKKTNLKGKRRAPTLGKPQKNKSLAILVQKIVGW